MNDLETYVVTGATSFIGVILCRKLIDEGHIVYAICRKDSIHLSDLHANSRLKIVYSDMAHINDIESIGRADVFVNLAWEGTSHFGRDNRAIQTDNFSHTLQAMRVSKKLGCELFVESGSQAEYGYVNDLITEETLCHPESEYGKAKLKVWTEGRVLANELHIKYIHLRIFSVFGENDHPWTLVISSISKMLHNEDIDLTSCTQNWNFLYVKDAVGMILGLCDYALKHQQFQQEIYNIASNDTRPLCDFVQEMYMLTNSKSKMHFGIIKSRNKVSLNPSIKKVSRVVKIEFTDFQTVINNIISIQSI